MNKNRDRTEQREPIRELEELVLTRVLRLNATLTGLVTGLVCGLGIFTATNWLVIKGGEVVGPHLQLLSQFFYGYQVTFLGSLIGLLYAFVAGFLIGYLFAFIYNKIVLVRRKRSKV
jgi:hypothetical protein